ncbi:MAG: hypothetical protein RJQ00_01705 [Vicingaceae bacterium]
MKNICLVLIVYFCLFQANSLLAQGASSNNTSDFDRETFKEQSYDMVELFSTEVYDSSEYLILLTVSSDYNIDGIGDKSRNDSSVVTNWVKKKNAQSAELLEDQKLMPGKETMNYVFEYLDPKSIITLRTISKEKIQVKRYELLFD